MTCPGTCASVESFDNGWFAHFLKLGSRLDDMFYGMSDAQLPKNLKILLADDEEDLLEVLGMMLEPLSDSIDTATSVEEAQKLLDSKPFDLILTDQTFGSGADDKNSGLDLWFICSKVYPEIPFILISGYPQLVFDQLTETGIQAPPYLSKPFSKEQLYEKISETVEKKKTEHAA